MPIGRFILCVVVAYIVYAILYIGIMGGLFPDTFAANADLMRPQDDPLVLYANLGHLVQTIAIVWLFDKAVGSNDLKAGAIFGLWVGVYLSATDTSTYMALKMNLEPWLPSIAVHLAAGAIVGAVLAKLYKGKETVAAEA